MKIYTNYFLNFGKTLTESTISYNKGEVLADVNASAGLNVIHSTKNSAQWGALQRYKVFLNLQWRTSPNSYKRIGFSFGRCNTWTNQRCVTWITPSSLRAGRIKLKQLRVTSSAGSGWLGSGSCSCWLGRRRGSSRCGSGWTFELGELEVWW